MFCGTGSICPTSKSEYDICAPNLRPLHFAASQTALAAGGGGGPGQRRWRDERELEITSGLERMGFGSAMGSCARGRGGLDAAVRARVRRAAVMSS